MYRSVTWYVQISERRAEIQYYLAQDLRYQTSNLPSPHIKLKENVEQLLIKCQTIKTKNYRFY